MNTFFLAGPRGASFVSWPAMLGASFPSAEIALSEMLLQTTALIIITLIHRPNFQMGRPTRTRTNRVAQQPHQRTRRTPTASLSASTPPAPTAPSGPAAPRTSAAPVAPTAAHAEEEATLVTRIVRNVLQAMGSPAGSAQDRPAAATLVDLQDANTRVTCEAACCSAQASTREAAHMPGSAPASLDIARSAAASGAPLLPPNAVGCTVIHIQ